MDWIQSSVRTSGDLGWPIWKERTFALRLWEALSPSCWTQGRKQVASWSLRIKFLLKKAQY